MLRARRKNYKVKKVMDLNPVSLEKGNRKGQYISVVTSSEGRTVPKKINQIKRVKALESRYNDILERTKIRKILKDPS